MQISATLSTAQWDRAIVTMGAKAPIAMSRALNRTATNVRAVMAPVIARDIGLKVGDVRNEFRLVTATPQHLVARVEIRGARVPIIKLNARGPEPSRGKGSGVRYRTGRGRGHLPHAFIATVGKGHRGVFARKGRARLPIQELFGPSLPHVFRQQLPVGIARAEEQLAKNIAHEFRFVLGQTV